MLHRELDSLLQGPLGAAQGQGTHPQPAQGESLQGDAESLSFLAQAVGGWHTCPIEIEGVAAYSPQPQCLFPVADLQAGRLRLRQEGGDACLGSGKGEDQARQGPVGHPDLGAVEGIVVAIPCGRGRQRCGVGAGARFGQCKGT